VTKGLPWGRLVAEGIVVVLSILLAFAIDAWWDGRQAASKRLVALANLETALETSIEEIDRELMRVNRWQHRVLTFTQLDPDTLGSVPTDTAAVLLEAVARPIVDDVGGGVIIEMLAADGLVDLEGADWHAAVAEWRNNWQWLRQRQESLYQIEREALLVLGRNESTQAAANMANRGAIQTLVANGLAMREEVAVGTGALRGALANPDFMALAYAKLAHWDALQLIEGALRAQGETLVSLVRGRLRS
jgi:hypothetical protein